MYAVCFSGSLQYRFLTAADPTTNDPQYMSTHTHPGTDPGLEPIVETFTTADAPRTFDPFNTRSCPQMFADKWQDTSDGLGGR